MLEDFFENRNLFQDNLYNKRVRPSKNEPQQGISYLERVREGGERKRGWEGQQAVIFKVRVRFGRDRGER